MLGTIANTERLAIYVLDSDKIKAKGIHWRAFLPGDDEERSLFRTDGLTEAEIAEIGQREVGDKAYRQIKGWAELTARHVTSKPPLYLVIAEPPERHAVIVGWPHEIHLRNSLAQQLAAASKKHPWPPPTTAAGPIP